MCPELIWENRYYLITINRYLYRQGVMASMGIFIDGEFTDLTTAIKSLLDLSPRKLDYVYISGRKTAYSILSEYLSLLKRKHNFTGRIPSQFETI